MRFLCAVSAVCLVFGLSFAQNKPQLGEFSADVVQLRNGKTDTQKLEVKIDRIRVEKADKGRKSAVIMRLDKGVTWTLLDKKQYMEMNTVSYKDAPGLRKEADSMVEIKKLGDETVAGYPCQKTLYIYKDKSLGEMTQWVSKKLAYAVKTEYRKAGKVEMTQELKNIKETAPDDADFEIPEGYQKFELPAGMGDMMKGMIPNMK